METLINLDKALLVLLNSFNSPFWDVVMMFFTRKEFWLPLYLVIFYQVFKFKGKPEYIWWLLGILLLIILCDQISTQFFKATFERFRPSHDPSLQGIIHLVSGYTGGQFGFVSSHATNTFGFAMFSSLLFRNKIYTTFVFTWALLVSYTRIYLGVHFPGDIIGGILLGLTIGFGVYHLVKWLLIKKGIATSFEQIKRHRLDNSVCWLIISVALLEVVTTYLLVGKLMRYGFFSM